MLDGLEALHDVGHLVGHRNILKFNTSFFNVFSNVVLMNTDVFHVSMEGWVDHKHQSALVIT